MPIEFDDTGLRVIGYRVKGLKFYNDSRELVKEIYLDTDGELNIQAAGDAGGAGSGMTTHQLAGSLHAGAADLTQYPEAIIRDGSRELTADWDAGDFEIRAQTLESDIATGTAPLTIASTTLVTNLNADLWDGYQFADYLDQAVKEASVPAFGGLTLNGDLDLDGDLDFVGAQEISTTAGDLTLNPAGNVVVKSLIPSSTDVYDLGSSSKLFRKGYLSELDALIFAEETISLIGGWFMIPHDAGSLGADLADSDDTADFGKAMTAGDFVVMRAIGQVEYFEVGANVAGTVYKIGADASGDRDLDGSGANSWPAGTAFAVLGASGDGRIELNAYDTPRISIFTQGATYNAQAEVARFGDLDGDWGYAAETWGLALGDSDHDHITIDPTNGIRFLDSSGTMQAEFGDGKLTAGNGNIWLNSEGLWLDGDLAGIYDSTSAINFVGDAADTVCSIYGWDYSNILKFNFEIFEKAGRHTNLEIQVTSPENYTSAIELIANGGTETGKLEVEGDYYTYGAKVTASPVLFTGGLNVGGSVYPDDDDIIYVGDLRPYRNSTAYTGYIFVPLTTRLTNASWDGDAKTTSDNGIIDLSTTHSVPSGVKAVLVRMIIGDESTNVWAACGPANTEWALTQYTQVANQVIAVCGPVPCDSNGDIYWACGGELDHVWIDIMGYWI